MIFDLKHLRQQAALISLGAGTLEGCSSKVKLWIGSGRSSNRKDEVQDFRITDLELESF